MACKKDKMMETEDFVDFKLAQKVSDAMGFHACVETSSKTGEGVTELFEIVAKELLRCEDMAIVHASSQHIDEVSNHIHFLLSSELSFVVWYWG